MNRLLITLLALLVILPSCEPQEGTTTHDDLYLRLNIYTEPPSLDPRIATDLTSMQVLSMLFEGLTRLDGEGRAQMAIAKEVEVSENGLVYTFTLRESFWSDGSPLTAHDFAYAMRSTLDPAFASPYSFSLYDIKNARLVDEGKIPMEELGVDAPDDHTLVLTLEHRVPYLLELVSGSHFFPVKEETVRAHPRWAADAGPHYVGNGPFTLESWRHSNEMVVVRNDRYWDREHVQLTGVRMSMVEDANTELSMFEEGEIDWTGAPISIGLPLEAIPALRESGKLRVEPMAATYFYLLNTKKVPFTNQKLRHALALALNRKEIVEHLLAGDQPVATGFVAPPLNFQEEPYFQENDLQLARRLFTEGLRELGLTRDTLPPITLSYNTSEAHRKIAQAIQQQWYDAFGFRASLENTEWKVYIDKIRSCDFDIARISWAIRYYDPLGFLEIFQYEDNGINCSGWTSPQYQELIARSRDLRGAERSEVLHEAEKILVDEMPIIPLYHLSIRYLKSDRLKGYIITPLGALDIKEAYLEE